MQEILSTSIISLIWQRFIWFCRCMPLKTPRVKLMSVNLPNPQSLHFPQFFYSSSSRFLHCWDQVLMLICLSLYVRVSIHTHIKMHTGTRGRAHTHTPLLPSPWRCVRLWKHVKAVTQGAAHGFLILSLWPKACCQPPSGRVCVSVCGSACALVFVYVSMTRSGWGKCLCLVSCGEFAAVHLSPDATLTFIDYTKFFAGLFFFFY